MIPNNAQTLASLTPLGRAKLAIETFPQFIVSPFAGGGPSEFAAAAATRDDALSTLAGLGILAIGVDGKLMGVDEPSLLVSSFGFGNELSQAVLAAVALGLGVAWQQKSILTVAQHEGRLVAELSYLNPEGNEKTLGEWVRVEADEAKAGDAYTHEPITGRYWIARPIVAVAKAAGE